MGTFPVDGAVAGGWSVRDGDIVLDPWVPLSTAARREVDVELEALQAFHGDPWRGPPPRG